MKYLLFCVSILVSFNILAFDKSFFSLETGMVWQHRNDVKNPPDSGSYVQFDQFDPGGFLHARVNAFYLINKKHGLRLVLAPFKIEVTGQSPTPIDFNGETYSANTDITVSYQFNSYRLGYVYNYYSSGDSFFHLGLTGKIRDAEIKFTQGSIAPSSDDNVGFVPLFYVAYGKQLGSDWSFFFDSDFAAAPQGRAIDMLFKFQKKVSDKMKAGVGYRTLEGGADNDEVFTFSWFNYLILDLQFEF
ncbi:MAG: hypothetical protein AB8E15_08100 [Bdellovibrionales bacterium]